MDELKKLYNKEMSAMFDKDEMFINLYNMVQNGNAVYIPRNVPSLKNNKQIFQMNTGKSICCNVPYIKLAVRQYKCTKCGIVSSRLGKRPIIVPSERHKKYKSDSTSDYIKTRKGFLKLSERAVRPYLIGLYFIRKTKNDWDYDNAYSTIADLMKSNDYIDDDNIHEVKPVFLGYKDDKEAAGVIITILKDIKYEFNNYVIDIKSDNSDTYNDIDII